MTQPARAPANSRAIASSGNVCASPHSRTRSDAPTAVMATVLYLPMRSPSGPITSWIDPCVTIYALITIEAAPTVVAKSAAIWGSNESVTRTCAWLAKATTASSTIERVWDFGGFSGAVGGTKDCNCGLRLSRPRKGAPLTGGVQGALYAQQSETE